MSGQSEMLSKAEDIADKVSQPTQQLNSPGLAATYGFPNILLFLIGMKFPMICLFSML